MEPLALTNTIESSMFSTFEQWGIVIAGIYFLIGFPANLLSIIVCFKSLFYRYFRRLGIKRRRKDQCKRLDMSFRKGLVSVAISSSQHRTKTSENKLKKNESEIILVESTKHRLNNSFKKKRDNQQRSIQCVENNSRKSMPCINARNFDESSKQIEVRQMKSFFNPHRKCFELYLIEISFCDLIIIGYNFLEWFLLILSEWLEIKCS